MVNSFYSLIKPEPEMVCLSEPVKCAQLSEHLGMERKVVDLAMKHLKEDSKVTSPKRGYWIISNSKK